jgi:hypothetical protein
VVNTELVVVVGKYEKVVLVVVVVKGSMPPMHRYKGTAKMLGAMSPSELFPPTLTIVGQLASN